jgi:hypothetical protein
MRNSQMIRLEFGLCVNYGHTTFVRHERNMQGLCRDDLKERDDVIY